MNHNTQGNSEIYPGCYIPSHTESDICAQTASGIAKETDCSISTTESNLYYELTMQIPTAKKEDIAIYAEDHVVTIIACRDSQKENREAGCENQLDVFFNKTVKLPQDADADFMHAVYVKGVLHIYISKSKNRTNAQHHPVAVY